MKTQIIDTDQGRIEYATEGKGKPVLFLHGGHSNCKEKLCHKGFDTDHYLLITPSRPGYGNTPLADKHRPQKAADLIIALLNHLCLDKIMLYAISAGGPTAIELASRYPERVEKFILASAVSKKWLDRNGKVYQTAKWLFHPSSERLVWVLIRFFSGIFPRMIAERFYPQFSTNKMHPLAITDIQELLATFRHFNSKTGFLCDIDHDLEPKQISGIQCPTLIVHSKNDNSVSFAHATYAHQMIKDSVLVGLDNEWGHLFWIGKDSHETISKTIAFIETTERTS